MDTGRTGSIGVGVVGCGYWGPNHIRNLTANRRTRLVYACDLDQDRLNHIGALYPQTCRTTRLDEMLADPQLDAVVIATPVSTHARLAGQALAAGKHVFIEKPMTKTLAEAEDLVRTARGAEKILMVGHTFLYAPAVQMIKRTIESGALGDLYYVNMQRLNLGLFQTDINVVWDLAPHDVSILLYLLEEKPIAVSAHGRANIHRDIEDVAMVQIQFEKGLIAFLHVSWVDPKKVRRAVFVGNKKMLVYDDIKDSEKVEIFDKGVSAPMHYDTFAEFKFAYRYGEKVTPYIHEEEPLKIQTAHFLECIATGMKPRTSGEDALSVLRVLEACQRSIKNGGAFVPVGG